MSEARFAVSAFGDEIADGLDEQLALLREAEIGYLELRGVWGKNVVDLTDAESERLASTCTASGIQVSAIGSPIGKSAITEPIARSVEKLHRIAQIAEVTGTRLVRVFSFYPPDDKPESIDRSVETAVERLEALVAVADEQDLMLLLENEKGIVGDTVDRCTRILRSIESPRLRFAWDPANFVQVGHGRPTDDGWSSLGGYTAHVHIKDVIAGNGKITPAGGGSGQIPELLRQLDDTGYVGYLALEPHLAVAGHSSGFSGPEGMRMAAKALRNVMSASNCHEVKSLAL